MAEHWHQVRAEIKQWPMRTLKEQRGGFLQSSKFILTASMLIPLLVILWCLNYSYILNATNDDQPLHSWL